jgi:hypothetical protein
MYMSLSRVRRRSIWAAGCALAVVTVAIAVKSVPLAARDGAATRAPDRAAAIARAPRAPAQAPPQAPRPMMRTTGRLPQRLAFDLLRRNGIGWRSTGGCTNRRNPTCTSLEGIRRGSIDGLIAFERRSRCRVVVTGGTEIGHAPGRYSHWNGYKIDIMPGRCVDRYITGRFRYAGTRGDGAALHRSPPGHLYADEGSHWDILYK